MKPASQSLVFTHTALDEEQARRVAERHVLCGFVHMPLFERDPLGIFVLDGRCDAAQEFEIGVEFCRIR